MTDTVHIIFELNAKTVSRFRSEITSDFKKLQDGKYDWSDLRIHSWATDALNALGVFTPQLCQLDHLKSGHIRFTWLAQQTRRSGSALSKRAVDVIRYICEEATCTEGTQLAAMGIVAVHFSHFGQSLPSWECTACDPSWAAPGVHAKDVSMHLGDIQPDRRPLLKRKMVQDTHSQPEKRPRKQLHEPVSQQIISAFNREIFASPSGTLTPDTTTPRPSLFSKPSPTPIPSNGIQNLFSAADKPSTAVDIISQPRHSRIQSSPVDLTGVFASDSATSTYKPPILSTAPVPIASSITEFVQSPARTSTTNVSPNKNAHILSTGASPPAPTTLPLIAKVANTAEKLSPSTVIVLSPAKGQIPTSHLSPLLPVVPDLITKPAPSLNATSQVVAVVSDPQINKFSLPMVQTSKEPILMAPFDSSIDPRDRTLQACSPTAHDVTSVADDSTWYAPYEVEVPKKNYHALYLKECYEHKYVSGQLESARGKFIVAREEARLAQAGQTKMFDTLRQITKTLAGLVENEMMEADIPLGGASSVRDVETVCQAATQRVAEIYAQVGALRAERMQMAANQSRADDALYTRLAAQAEARVQAAWRAADAKLEHVQADAEQARRVAREAEERVVEVEREVLRERIRADEAERARGVAERIARDLEVEMRNGDSAVLRATA